MAVKAVLLGANDERSGTWSTFRKMRLEDEKTRDFEATEQGRLTAEERLIRDLTQIEGLGPEAEKFPMVLRSLKGQSQPDRPDSITISFFELLFEICPLGSAEESSDVMSARTKRLGLIYEMVRNRSPNRVHSEDVYKALALEGVSRDTIKGYLETLRDSGQIDWYYETHCYTIDDQGRPWSDGDKRSIVLYLELPTGKKQGVIPKVYTYPDGTRIQDGPDYEE